MSFVEKISAPFRGAVANVAKAGVATAALTVPLAAANDANAAVVAMTDIDFTNAVVVSASGEFANYFTVGEGVNFDIDVDRLATDTNVASPIIGSYEFSSDFSLETDSGVTLSATGGETIVRDVPIVIGSDALIFAEGDAVLGQSFNTDNIEFSTYVIGFGPPSGVDLLDSDNLPNALDQIEAGGYDLSNVFLTLGGVNSTGGTDNVNIQISASGVSSTTSITPEPGSLALLGLGGLMLLRRPEQRVA